MHHSINYKHIIAKLPMLTKEKVNKLLTHGHALNRKAPVNNSGLLKKFTYQSRRINQDTSLLVVLKSLILFPNNEYTQHNNSKIRF